MSLLKRASVLVLAFLLLFSSTALAAKKPKATATPAPPQVPTEVLDELPQTIIDLLELAESELLDVNGKELKKKNKYTKWRNNGEYGWCGGFITWCMLEAGIPMEEKNKIEDGEVGGLFHVKEAGVGKLYEGFAKLNRITRVPQKGFIAVYGNEGSGGSTPYYHVGLVYDVEKLSDGIYRITTIEGNVKGHTVRMYVRDYDMNKASDKKQKPKDMTLVPEEERDREETNIFSYGYAYTKKKMYLTIFLMPWIPEESQAATEE